MILYANDDGLLTWLAWLFRCVRVNVCGRRRKGGDHGYDLMCSERWTGSGCICFFGCVVEGWGDWRFGDGGWGREG